MLWIHAVAADHRGGAPKPRVLTGEVTNVDVGSSAGIPQQHWEWSWPPEAPWHPDEGARYLTDEWAPASAVRRPWMRLGRWTVLYRRATE